jgi:hypothetical protein
LRQGGRSKGKSQLCSAKLVASTNGTFVLTIPSSQEEDNNNDDDDGSSSSSSNDDNDIFDEMFRMEDEENEGFFHMIEDVMRGFLIQRVCVYVV